MTDDSKKSSYGSAGADFLSDFSSSSSPPPSPDSGPSSDDETTDVDKNPLGTSEDTTTSNPFAGMSAPIPEPKPDPPDTSGTDSGNTRTGSSEESSSSSGSTEAPPSPPPPPSLGKTWVYPSSSCPQPGIKWDVKFSECPLCNTPQPPEVKTMWYCCGLTLHANEDFCPNCGNRRGLCPSCNQSIPTNPTKPPRFCPRCGVEINPPTTPPPGGGTGHTTPPHGTRTGTTTPPHGTHTHTPPLGTPITVPPPEILDECRACEKENPAKNDRCSCGASLIKITRKCSYFDREFPDGHTLRNEMTNSCDHHGCTASTLPKAPGGGWFHAIECTKCGELTDMEADDFLVLVNDPFPLNTLPENKLQFVHDDLGAVCDNCLAFFKQEDGCNYESIKSGSSIIHGCRISRAFEFRTKDLAEMRFNKLFTCPKCGKPNGLVLRAWSTESKKKALGTFKKGVTGFFGGLRELGDAIGTGISNSRKKEPTKKENSKDGGNKKGKK